MLHAKFRGDRPSSSGEDFLRFLSYMVRFLPYIYIFISMYLKAFIQSFGQIVTVVSEKIQFEFLYVHDLGPRSRNDLDLQYSHIFINLIRCMLLLTFRSLAAIVSEKSTVFTFSYRKACIGQGHSRVIIYTNYDGRESQMQHAKLCGNRPASSGEEDFLRFLPYMGVAAILVM